MSPQSSRTRDGSDGKGNYRTCHNGSQALVYRSHWFQTLVIAVVLSLARCETVDHECTQPGWFGPDCAYQCHCTEDPKCQPNGECTGGCAEFWFGPKCQYRYAELRLEGKDYKLTQLTDTNASTCLTDFGNAGSISVELLYPQRLHWMRFKLSKGGSSNDLRFDFHRRLEFGNMVQVCSSSETKWFEDKTYDTHCSEPDYVHRIVISGYLSLLCSLYVSVGINVALKQKVSQSNTLKKWSGKQAVDGVVPNWSKDTTEKDLAKTCARTGQQASGIPHTWKLFLPEEIRVSRLIIYDGMNIRIADCCKSDIVDVTVSGFTKNGELAFSSTLAKNDGGTNKTILPRENFYGLVKTVVVSRPNRSLTLCEVQVFKESTCPWGQFGLNCEHSCFCDRTGQSCNPVTGICPALCSGGYVGRQCAKPCKNGTFGPNCKQRCSFNCKDSYECEPETGTCYGGCKKGYAKPYCDYEMCANKHFFGRDCMLRCLCKDTLNACDRVTGECSPTEKDALKGDCHKYHFGAGCQERRAKLAKNYKPYALYDEDDSTCLDRNYGLVVQHFVPSRTHMVRIVAKKMESIGNYSITLSGDSGVMKCHTQWNAPVANNARHFLCASYYLMNKVIISGPNLSDLCSVYVGIGRNILVKQPSKFISNRVYEKREASRAVDGFQSGEPEFGVLKNDSTTCAHSDVSGSVETWEVEFPPVRNVTLVAIQNMMEEKLHISLNGHRLEFVDSSETILRKYKDKSKEKKMWYMITNFAHIWETVRKFRIISNGKDNLMLCEVFLFADRDCPRGMYGFNCEHTCNCKHGADYCFPDTGACPTGCRHGFRGFDCWQRCDAGTYGSDCKSRCSDNCHGGSHACSDIDGACKFGCVDGYQPPLCVKSCEKGFYGRGCTHMCSSGCGEDFTCNPFNGHCKDYQCKPGYIGPQCNNICPATNYGVNCQMNCSSTCAVGACHHVTGKCYFCSAGMVGQYCEKKCPKHKHGFRCLQDCSKNCYEAQCESVHGKCERCESGRTGAFCEKTCEPGFYGVGCKKSCSPYCSGGPKACFAVNGSCVRGCQDGKTPPLCADAKKEEVVSAVAGPVTVVSSLVFLSLCAFVIFKERRKEGVRPAGSNTGKDAPEERTVRASPSSSSSHTEESSHVKDEDHSAA